MRAFFSNTPNPRPHPKPTHVTPLKKFPSGSGGISGTRPSPLKISKKSYKIRKSPLPPAAHQPAPAPEHRKPGIIYSVSPKVPRVPVEDFKNVMQRLSGFSSGDETALRSGEVSMAARIASIEKTRPSERERVHRGDDDTTWMLEGVEVGQFPGILSPATLPPISQVFSSGPQTTSFSHELSPFWSMNSFVGSPFPTHQGQQMFNLLSNSLDPTQRSSRLNLDMVWSKVARSEPNQSDLGGRLIPCSSPQQSQAFPLSQLGGQTQGPIGSFPTTTNRSQSPSSKRDMDRVKGPWSPEEDEALQRLVQLHPRNWSLISKSIPGRSGKSCRLRWCNQLRSKVEHRPFSAIIAAHASASMKSSSIAGDEEYDSRADSSSISSLLNNTPTNPQALFPTHQCHHMFDPLSNFLDLTPRSSRLNLDMVWSKGPNSEPNQSDLGGSSITCSSPQLNQAFPLSQLGGQTLGAIGSFHSLPHSSNNNNSNSSIHTGLIPKRKSRASRRATTTILTTDITNFRALVQAYTGMDVPRSPFTSSPLPRTSDESKFIETVHKPLPIKRDPIKVSFCLAEEPDDKTVSVLNIRELMMLGEIKHQVVDWRGSVSEDITCTYMNLSSELQHLPDHLRFLSWDVSPPNSFPLQFPPKNFSWLTCINLSNNQSITEIPDVSEVPNLRELRLDKCWNLIEVHRSVGFLKKLTHFSASKCTKLVNFNCFPKLIAFNALENKCVSPPPCIKECVSLITLGVSFCRELRKIPKCTNLRILDVHGCVNLEEISELPSTIQKVDARCCFSLTRDTSDMLWLQVRKERRYLVVVMPRTDIPEWFDFIGNGGSPRFWARAKFPIFALVLLFHDLSECSTQSRSQLVKLHLLINGQCVPPNAYYNFRIAQDHFLICDLRVLFTDNEWHSLHTFLKHDWNLVQVSYEAAPTLTLTSWGIFVYKQETNVGDVQFMCPYPEYLDSHTLMESVDEISQGSELEGDDINCNPKIDDNEEAEPEYFGHKDLALDVEASSSGHIWEEDGNDTQQQEIMRGIFSDGMVDGLVEAKSSFRDLDIGKTLSAALDKRVACSFLESDPEVEMKVYRQGIIYGLQEAWLSFPNLDIEATIDAVLNSGAHDEAPVDLREASAYYDQGCDSEEEQDSYPRQQKMRRMLWEGMADGLLEAIRTFPTLDIQTTIRTALNKITWLPPNPQVEVNIYIKGIVRGVHEAKLTFPTLDIQATLNVVLSRETQKGPPDIEPQPMVNEILEQHQNLADTDEDDDDEAIEASEISDSESLASTSTETLTDIGREDCTGLTKYEKLAAILKGRVQELRMLYDAEMESFHNSKKFEHLRKAVYWKGLIDGLLDAPSILHAMDEEIITDQVLKENEAAKEKHVEAADNENLDGRIGVIVSSPERKRQKRETIADILGYKRDRDDTGFEQGNKGRKREKGN